MILNFSAALSVPEARELVEKDVSEGGPFCDGCDGKEFIPDKLGSILPLSHLVPVKPGRQMQTGSPSP